MRRERAETLGPFSDPNGAVGQNGHDRGHERAREDALACRLFDLKRADRGRDDLAGTYARAKARAGLPNDLGHGRVRRPQIDADGADSS